MASGYALVTKADFQSHLALHAWFGEPGAGAGSKAKHAQAARLADRLFANAPDHALVFPFPFEQLATELLCEAGPARLSVPEARFVYDNLYRMLYELVLGRRLPAKCPTCHDDEGEPIEVTKKAYKRPAGFSD